MNKNQVQVIPVVSIANNQTFTTSTEIARIFGKQHKDVLKAIRSIQILNDFHKRNFAPVNIIEENAIGGKVDKSYCNVTRDGLVILAMGFTGVEALKLKVAYIEEFNRMEAKLVRNSPWGVELPPPYKKVFKNATVVELRHRARTLRNIGDPSFIDVSGIMIAGMTKEELTNRLVGSANTYNYAKKPRILKDWNSANNIKKYTDKSGCVCPFCGSSEIYDNETIYGHLGDYCALEGPVETCKDCKTQWVEIYNFTGVQKIT